MKKKPKIFRFFLSHTGEYKEVSSLEELRNTMILDASQESIEHHVREGKNDFAEWIEESIGDKFLAEKIKAAGMDRGEIIRVLRDNIGWLNVEKN